jgi:FkbM family methyltransferase
MKLGLTDFDDQSPWGTYPLTSWFALALSIAHRLPPALAPLTKALRRPVKYRAPGPLDLVIWSLKLRLMPRGNIAEQKLYTAPQLFDRAECRALGHILSEGGVFLDIGANAGVYSFWASVASKGKARVLAFEPDVEMRRRLEFNRQTNDLSNIMVYACALSDQDGEMTFWINEGQRGTNSLELPTEAQQASRTKVTVPVRPLVEVLIEAGITTVDALKIDVEGHEPPILRHFFANAPQSLWPRLLIAEVMHLSPEVLADLIPDTEYRKIHQTGLNAVWLRCDQADFSIP